MPLTQAFLTFPTNRAITFWRRCRGTLSLPSSNDISLVSLAYLATPLAFPPISLVVSGKLSGDSIDFSQRATLPSVIYSKLWDHGLLGTNVSNY